MNEVDFTLNALDVWLKIVLRIINYVVNDVEFFATTDITKHVFENLKLFVIFK